jgi:hypothetical protein
MAGMVGYGDVYPVTTEGRISATVTSYLPCCDGHGWTETRLVGALQRLLTVGLAGWLTKDECTAVEGRTYARVAADGRVCSCPAATANVATTVVEMANRPTSSRRVA